MVNVDQQDIVPEYKLKKADNIRLTVTLWCGIVCMVAMEKQRVVMFCVCFSSLI